MSDIDKFIVIMDEVHDGLDLLHAAYEKKLYKNVVKISYETMLFIGESIAAYKGIQIRKNDCHLQTEILMRNTQDEFEISSSDIDFYEKQRPIRNGLVHPENHYKDIKENKSYEEIATLSILHTESMVKSMDDFIYRHIKNRERFL
jgi:hypothetical protein